MRQLYTFVVPLKLECIPSMCSLELWKRLDPRLLEQVFSHSARNGDVFHFKRIKEGRGSHELD